MMEAQLVLSTIARRYQVQITPGQRIEAAPLITLRPTPGIRATLNARSAVAA